MGDVEADGHTFFHVTERGRREELNNRVELRLDGEGGELRIAGLAGAPRAETVPVASLPERRFVARALAAMRRTAQQREIRPVPKPAKSRKRPVPVPPHAPVPCPACHGEGLPDCPCCGGEGWVTAREAAACGTGH